MGQQISDARKKLKEMEAKEKAEEQLSICEKMVKEHLNRVHQEVIEGERGDEQIHTGTLVFSHQMIYIKAQKKASDGVVNAVSDIFSGKFLKGIESLVKSAANTILGNTSVGQFEDQDMFILWNSNALLRVDVYYYRWNFAGKGAISESDHVMGVLILKRVINLAKTNVEVLTWAISETAKRAGITPEKSLDTAFKLLSKVITFQTKLRTLELTAKGGDDGDGGEEEEEGDESKEGDKKTEEKKEKK